MHRMEAISGRLSGSRKIWMGTNRVAPDPEGTGLTAQEARGFG